MYENHWGLQRKPFANTSGNGQYYPGESHQGALLKLRYAIESRRPAAVLAGAAGTGKSLLARTLFRQLSSNYDPRIHLVFPQMPPDQLLAYLADELDPVDRNAFGTPSVDTSVRRIRQRLMDNAQHGKHAVIVIDEAHVLEECQALETIRLLLNFEANEQNVATIVLVGQPQLIADLDRFPSLEERFGVKCLLRPFTADETASYVSHRMAAAGAQRAIFDEHALQALHDRAKGIPRRINRLADLALLVGFAEGCEIVDASRIEAVAREMVAVTPD
jgi:general secretion pathway protein A